VAYKHPHSGFVLNKYNLHSAYDSASDRKSSKKHEPSCILHHHQERKEGRVKERARNIPEAFKRAKII